MKRLFTSIATLSLFFVAKTQNIGIGITTPRAKLHIFQGASGNTTPYSPLVVENDAHTYVNLLSPDANETGVLFGNSTEAARGGIIYNNTGTLNGFQFRTAGNQTRMVITSNGFVGIGTTNPGAPLAFSGASGRKITLFPGVTGAAGFGVENTRLQIITHDINGDITFGYDLFGNIYETFGIKANGAFVVNGTTGSAGQVLQSNGTARPSWANPTNLLYSNTAMISSNTATLINTSSPVALPFSHTFTTTTSAKVLVTFGFHTTAFSCFACGKTRLYLDLNLNGVSRKRFAQDIQNDGEHLYSGTFLLTVGPGTHTISFVGARTGPDVYVGHQFLGSQAVYQIIPQ